MGCVRLRHGQAATRGCPQRDDRVALIKARHVVEYDGARSQVRRTMGHELSGELANQAWDVIDVLAYRDFPDIRPKGTVHSANDGNILIKAYGHRRAPTSHLWLYNKDAVLFCAGDPASGCQAHAIPWVERVQDDFSSFLSSEEREFVLNMLKKSQRPPMS